MGRRLSTIVFWWHDPFSSEFDGTVLSSSSMLKYNDFRGGRDLMLVVRSLLNSDVQCSVNKSVDSTSVFQGSSLFAVSQFPF